MPKIVFMLLTFYTGPSADLGVLWGHVFDTRQQCEIAGEQQNKFMRDKDGTLADYLCVGVPNND